MTSPRSARTAMVTLGLVTCVLAGCGGGGTSKAKPVNFERQYRALQIRYKPVGVGIVTTLATAPNIPDDTLAVILRDHGRRLGELHDQLAKLVPRATAKPAYRTYLDNLASAQQDLNVLGFDAGTRDAQAARVTNRLLVGHLRSGHDSRIAFERAAGIIKP